MNPLPDLPDELHLRFSLTPGKPDSPTEVVEIKVRHSQATLRAYRRTADSPIPPSLAARLPLEDAEALWSTLRALKEFRPQEVQAAVADFGERELSLSWSHAEGAHGKTEWTWRRPLIDDQPIEDLRRHLAALTLRFAPQAGLRYF